MSVMVAVAVLGGCGGGGGGVAKTKASDSATDTATESDSGESIKQYCKDVKPLSQEDVIATDNLSEAMHFAYSGGSFPKYVKPVAKIAAKAPDEIRQDWKKFS